MNSLEKSLNLNPIVEDSFADVYESLTIYPPDFDPKDPDRIKIFAKRLKESREQVTKRNGEIKYWQNHPIEGPRYCCVTTQEEVASWLGLSVQRISQYENGKIKAIPTEYLVAFYDMFGVSPHYLLGYTDEYDELLASRNGELLKKEDGTYVIVKEPISFPVLSQKTVVTILTRLVWKKAQWFLTLCKFLRASDQTMETGFKILDVLLESEKKSKSDNS